MARTALCVAAAWIALGAPALAQEAPEAVYDKFHRAVLARSAQEQARLASDELAGEIRGYWFWQRWFASKLFPPSYKLTGREVSRDGSRVQLRGSATHAVLFGEPAPMYGIADLVKVGAEWKVRSAAWAHDEWPQEKLD